MAPAAVGGLGIAGVVLVLLFNLFAGGSSEDILSQLENIPIQQQQGITRQEFEGEDSYEVFASKVLGSNNEMWQAVFDESLRDYSEPKLVLFRTATQSACGVASSKIGPHYCPLDKTIYIDETFFDELTTRFGAEGGDVAEAYVIAHEVGHHAQNELGIMSEVDSRQSNDLSVRMELQADCFAGLWAHSIRDQGVFEQGEIHEAMDAAAAVGDDRIQQKSSGYVNPEAWTHGSSEQRVAWFDRGYSSGSLAECDTF
jgi:predicted metalloprotease